MNIKQAAKLAHPHHWFSIWMPYHLAFLGKARGRYVYLPLNREYRLLGTTQAMGKLSDYWSRAIGFTSDPASLADVFVSVRNGLWLYNDFPSSRVDYFKRLDRLLSRSIAVPAGPSRAGGLQRVTRTAWLR